MVDDEGRLRINGSVSIPRSELTFRASRSGGPGGQHVNTSSTRIELTWDIAGSPSLSEEERARAMSGLAGRINADGQLRLTSAESRSQLQNREAVTRRFVELLAQALHVPRPRHATRIPAAERKRRLTAKKRRADTKRLRGPVTDE